MIWVVGSHGMLGKELCEYFRGNAVQFVGTDKECDITDLQALNNYSKDKNINWIINCSAYTAVDKAEDESEAAFKLNEEGAYNLAIVAENIGAKIIYISTDYVFGGKGSEPHKVDDPVNPLGVYGQSKVAGEYAVKEMSRHYFIIRTSWLYGKYGNNFVTTMIRKFKEIEFLNVVNDQRGCPTWTYNLTEAIYCIVKNDLDKYGVYHFSNRGEITWYEFALEIYRLALQKGIINKKVEINPVSSDMYPSKVKRPSYSVLDLDKITIFKDIKLSDWKESLNKYLDLI